ncbi:MAG: hypothetical protein KAU21_12620, partial [Gammaproteobacteria bacterium]|nr:hypothetical protein [Gammaproteobacteria bacterium]
MKFKTSLPLIMILSLLFSSRIIAAELSVTLDKSEAEMGKYFLADIRYQGESAAGEFNLTEWQDNFYIDLQDSETVDIGIDKELQQKTSRVRLYPRHSGQITLAS